MISDILITISQAQIKAQGYRSILHDFEECSDPFGDDVYYIRLPGKPKHELHRCYIVIAGAIRWKATVVFVREACTMHFYHNFTFERGEADHEAIYGRAWLVLADFVKLPRPYEKRKGFQGFRYINSNQ